MPFTPYNPTPTASPTTSTGFTPFDVESAVNTIPSSQEITNKIVNPPSTSPFNPNSADSQFVDPNAKTGTGWGHSINDFVQALPQASYDSTVTPVKNLMAQAGTRMAQAGVQTKNEFQNPGYDTATDTGNPQRANAGGTVKANPIPSQTPQANTSNSETNINKSQNILGTTVEPQQQGVEGTKQIGEQGLNAAAGIGVVGGVEQAAEPVIKGVSEWFDALSGLKENLFAPKPNFTPVTPEEMSTMSPEESANAQAGNKLNEANQAHAQSAQDLESAKAKTQAATEKVNQTAQDAVQGRDSAAQKISGKKVALGKEFEAGAKNIKGTTTLSNDQIAKISDLNNTQKYNLPDSVKAKITSSNLNGEVIPRDPVTGKAGAQINISDTGNKSLSFRGEPPSAKLTAPEAHQLMTQLNNTTYDPSPEGLKINQKTVALQQELKAQFSKDFGSQWDNVYSKYSKGINAFKNLDKVVNLQPDANPTVRTNNINTINKLGKDPVGSVNLQNALDKVSSIHPDLNLDEDFGKIQAHGEATDEFKQSQKDLTDAQKTHATNEKAAQAANEKFGSTQDKLQSAKQQATAKAQADAEKAVQDMKGAAKTKFQKLYNVAKKLTGTAATLDLAKIIYDHITGN